MLSRFLAVVYYKYICLNFSLPSYLHIISRSLRSLTKQKTSPNCTKSELKDKPKICNKIRNNTSKFYCRKITWALLSIIVTFVVIKFTLKVCRRIGALNLFLNFQHYFYCTTVILKLDDNISVD